jgi:hypothetical protein
MINALIFLAAGASDAAQAKEMLDAALAKSHEVMEQGFDCMDKNVKEQFLKQTTDATPESVVNAALAACSYLKEAYASAATTQYITADKARELADGWFSSLRDTYLTHLQKRMIDPAFAEARRNLAISEWRKCVTDKATDWSRLQDEAQTVARAAVTACSEFRPKVQVVVTYELQSKQLPVTGAREVMDTLETTLQDVAVETVISERAKRLPRPR